MIGQSLFRDGLRGRRLSATIWLYSLVGPVAAASAAALSSVLPFGSLAPPFVSSHLVEVCVFAVLCCTAAYAYAPLDEMRLVLRSPLSALARRRSWAATWRVVLPALLGAAVGMGLLAAVVPTFWEKVFAPPLPGLEFLLKLLLSALGCGLLCYTLGRYNREVVLGRWDFVLDAPARQAIESLRLRMALDSTLVRAALEAAERAREANRPDDALTVLRVALSVLVDAGEDRLTRLQAMRVYSRIVRAARATSPSPAPSAAPFRSTKLRGTETVAGFLHHFIVGTQERFQLWLLVLGLGVLNVVHSGRRSADAASRAPGRKKPWEDFARGVDDFEALDARHLAAFEALVASLAAVDQGGRARVWEQIIDDAS